MRRQWKTWALGALGIIILLGPVGRYLAVTPSGRWLILTVGFLLGFSLGGWWTRMKEDEEELLRGRLVRGEIRLTEYRLLCRELGITKKKKASLKNEEEFSTIDGT